MVGEDHVARSVKLNQDVVAGLSLAEGQVDDAINAKLFNLVELLGAEVLAKLHREATGQVLLVLDVICRVNAHARLNQQVLLPIGLR